MHFKSDQQYESKVLQGHTIGYTHTKNDLLIPDVTADCFIHCEPMVSEASWENLI